MHIVNATEHRVSDPVEFIRSQRSDYLQTLSTHGAILLRGFDLEDAADFAAAGSQLIDQWMAYQDRASRRSVVTGPVLTSTDTPASYPIALHSESSFTAQWPRKILFFCRVRPHTGGRTPIADTRRVYAEIDPALRDKFERLGVMYLRNFTPGVGMDWRDVFQVEDPEALESYCRAAKIHTEWVDDNHLRTLQVRPAVCRHPSTGEALWFNHALALSQFSLDAKLRNTLLRQVGEEGLPHNTYFGNGEPISEAEFDQIRHAHDQHTEWFDWQPGDLLLLDNMLMTHGREPFQGRREILAALADPLSWSDLGVDVQLPLSGPAVADAPQQMKAALSANKVEQPVFTGWMVETLKREFELDIEDLNQSFLDAGGDSVTAVELLDLTVSEFGVEFSIDDFLDAPSLAEFSKRFSATLNRC